MVVHSLQRCHYFESFAPFGYCTMANLKYLYVIHFFYDVSVLQQDHGLDVPASVCTSTEISPVPAISTTLIFTITKSSSLCSDKSVAVLDAVAIAAINNATFNFLRDGFIWLELFSITSYPSPWQAGFTSQFASSTGMFFWYSFLCCIPWNSTSQMCDASSASHQKRWLLSFLHRWQCHNSTMDPCTRYWSIHIINILYLLVF